MLYHFLIFIVISISYLLLPTFPKKVQEGQNGHNYEGNKKEMAKLLTGI